MKRIKFGTRGNLPAPTGHPSPQIFLCSYHPIFESDFNRKLLRCRMGLPFKNEEDHSKDTRYIFFPTKPLYWSDWKAFAWEDCEVGMGTISARTPGGKRFAWTVRFSHDGDPRLEFWGASFDIPNP